MNHGKKLREIKGTAIILVPKGQCHDIVTDFIPISCYNTIYKCISKMICDRLRKILPDIIAENQGAFVHSKYIAHIIIICQNIASQNGRKNVKHGCMIKLDFLLQG